MQKYDVTLTLSKKHIPIYADSYEKAMAQIGDMVAGLVLMDFREEEIECPLPAKIDRKKVKKTE